MFVLHRYAAAMLFNAAHEAQVTVAGGRLRHQSSVPATFRQRGR
jgi:hypothetical protein